MSETPTAAPPAVSARTPEAKPFEIVEIDGRSEMVIRLSRLPAGVAWALRTFPLEAWPSMRVALTRSRAARTLLDFIEILDILKRENEANFIADVLTDAEDEYLHQKSRSLRHKIRELAAILVDLAGATHSWKTWSVIRQRFPTEWRPLANRPPEGPWWAGGVVTAVPAAAPAAAPITKPEPEAVTHAA